MLAKELLILGLILISGVAAGTIPAEADDADDFAAEVDEDYSSDDSEEVDDLTGAGVSRLRVDDGDWKPDFSHVTEQDGVPTVEAIIEPEDRGQKEVIFRAPFFDPAQQASPKEAKQFSNTIITDVIGHAKTVVKSALVEGRGYMVLYSQIVSVATQLLMKIGYYTKESKRLDKLYGRKKDKGQFKDSIGLLPALLNQANAEKDADKKAAKNYKDPALREQTGHRMLTLLDGIKQLVLNSPVGTALKFKEIQVDGKPLFEELVEHIKFMRKANLGFILDRAAKICHGMEEKADKEEADERAALEKAAKKRAAAAANGDKH